MGRKVRNFPEAISYWTCLPEGFHERELHISSKVLIRHWTFFSTPLNLELQDIKLLHYSLGFVLQQQHPTILVTGPFCLCVILSDV